MDLLSPAAPGFDDPIGVLEACHGRVLKHCATLMALVTHLAEQGLDDAAQEAAQQIHRYFSTAGQHHHEDEEQDLFPILRNKNAAIAALISQLETEHRQFESLWSRLEPLLAKPESITDLMAFTQLATEYDNAYQHHVALENTQLLPKARQLLSTAEQTTLGKAMAARRGVAYSS